jgi:hypothetical protein
MSPSRSRRRRTSLAALGLASSLVLVGCGEDDGLGRATGPGLGFPAPPGAAAPGAAPGTPSEAAGPSSVQARVLRDADFVESELIAIISGIEQPRAMLVDERGVGHVTTRGDFVGVAEVVQTGGAENLPVALNWRVDRIRDNEVVLAREDPTGPNRPPLTQVIPLHPADEGPEGISRAALPDET